MKLKSLRLHGFKSFPDPTRVVFHDGITAIVGPNGCGKSNIGDAVRWVLGEQRPTAIRGARMDEVIFQGAAGRRGVGRASVSMTVTNDDGALPIPMEEVEIGRTVHRDGGSDYRLNRAECRLRDILDLCRDTGLGANAYSIIEIRMIDAILSERTDERRLLFEEAAGIGKYKSRRRTALRRLETSEVDLQRVEDVIGEVQSKVRSLARQKGKAQRHRTLRKRRLALEAALARSDLADLARKMSALDAALEADRERSAGASAALAAAEAGLERKRLERLEAERARAEWGGRLDSVGAELARVETEAAVTDERLANGARRLERIGAAQERMSAQLRGSEDDRGTLKRERDKAAGLLASASGELRARAREAEAAKGRLDEARSALGVLEDRGRGVTRTLARLEGDRDGARLQAGELERRLEHLERDARRGAGALRDIESQRDLFSDRRDAATAAADDADRGFDEARRRLARVRTRLREAREAERAASARASELEAERTALIRVADSDEGAGAVAEAAGRAFPDAVRGTLSDFVRVSGASARGVDALMGAHAWGLVVAARSDCERIADWYHGEDGRSAPLLLLPLDGAPDPRGRLPAGVETGGDGAPWVRALLGGAEVGEGAVKDADGAVRLAPRGGAEGRLERKTRIEALTAQGDRAAGRLAEARRTAAQLAEDHVRCETEADAASDRVLSARDSARAAAADAQTQGEEQQRLARQQEEAALRLEQTGLARDRALRRQRDAELERARLQEQEASLSDEIRRARDRLAGVDAEWERAREAASEATIQAARIESRLERIDGQLKDARETVAHATERLDALAVEKDALGDELLALRDRREARRDAIQSLFGQRDDLRAKLAQREQAMNAAAAGVTESERALRDLRARDREAVGRRHELELRVQDVRNRAARIGERLEAEWGRPVAALVEEAEPVEGDPAELRSELADIVARLGRIGPVNMLAVEEHAEEQSRLEFLLRQRDDLTAARDDLRAAIRRINATATDLFTESFEAIRTNFRSTFAHLFSGGTADLRLADPDNPLESPIEVRAAPGGKRTQRIDLLSGGERALTALSLLFGIYLVKPSPFCVLDEVDAPLDESNIGRFIRLLHRLKAQTQFVVITHNPRTIEAADWIYGVTMEEPGVSSIVGVRLEGPAPGEPPAPTTDSPSTG